MMYEHVNPKNGDPAPLIAEDVYNIIVQVRMFWRQIPFALLVHPQCMSACTSWLFL